MSERGRAHLKVDFKTRMFKCFQRFPFIETNRYLSKPFKVEELIKKDWVQTFKTMIGRLGLGNLIQNVLKIINWVIPKEEYKSKYKFFKKRATDSYFQTFYSITNNNENKELLKYLKIWKIKVLSL